MQADKPATDTTPKAPKRKLDDFEIVVHPQKSTSDLGKGSYGSVVLVKDKEDPDKLYAMKIVTLLSVALQTAFSV